MPKYLLLKHCGGAPEPHRPVPPMDQWAPVDVEAQMAFLKHVSELLGGSRRESWTTPSPGSKLPTRPVGIRTARLSCV